jgi:hypothetical protein
MLKVLMGTPVGIMSLITVVATMVVITFWLYYIFKKHDE